VISSNISVILLQVEQKPTENLQSDVTSELLVYFKMGKHLLNNILELWKLMKLSDFGRGYLKHYVSYFVYAKTEEGCFRMPVIC
jgi:hypothetical protein